MKSHLTPNNIFAKCSIWSAEETSSKKNLHDAIYFCPTLELLRKRNVEQTKSKWFQMFLWNPRSNPGKKFQVNKNLINAAIYLCEFLELIRIRNVNKQRQTIFMPNARSNQQKKLRAKKISMMPYISIRPSNCSAEEMSSKQNLSDSKCYCEILDRIRGRNFKQTKKVGVDSSWKMYNSLPAISH